MARNLHRVRVYRVTPDDSATRFQLENPDEFLQRYPDAFRNWPMCGMNHALPDAARMVHPSGTLTDFGWLMPGAIVWSRLRDEELYYSLEADILMPDCESLRLTVSASKWNQHLALNPMVCNVLDLARSQVRRDDSGRIIEISRYAFADHRLSYPIFRLPCGSPWEIFALYQIDEPEDLPFADLYSAYVKLGLKGLKFEPVWEAQISV